MANGVFISYRRSDSAGYAGRIADYLSNEFPGLNVFMDASSLRPGDDFVRSIQSSLDASGIVLPLIGEEWLYAEGRSGERRLEDPQDFVRLELELSLQAKKRIIPILLNETLMPAAETLPRSICQLTRYHAFRLRHETFKRDIVGLAELLSEEVQTRGDHSGAQFAPRFAGAIVQALEAAFRRFRDMDDPDAYMIVANTNGKFVQFIGLFDGEVLLDLPTQNMLPRQMAAAQRFLQESYTVNTQDLGQGELAFQTVLPAEPHHLALITLSLFEQVHEDVPQSPLEITFGR